MTKRKKAAAFSPLTCLRTARRMRVVFAGLSDPDVPVVANDVGSPVHLCCEADLLVLLPAATKFALPLAAWAAQ
jgi:hypothetical protein